VYLVRRCAIKHTTYFRSNLSERSLPTRDFSYAHRVSARFERRYSLPVCPKSREFFTGSLAANACSVLRRFTYGNRRTSAPGGAPHFRNVTFSGRRQISVKLSARGFTYDIDRRFRFYGELPENLKQLLSSSYTIRNISFAAVCSYFERIGRFSRKTTFQTSQNRFVPKQL